MRDKCGIKECLGMINHMFGDGKMGTWNRVERYEVEIMVPTVLEGVWPDHMVGV